MMKTIRNLMKETLTMLTNDNYTIKDILYISIMSKYGPRSIPVDDFFVMANHQYDAGFGTQKVDGSLTIMMKDGGRYYRKEYDGAECWAFVPAPKLVIPPEYPGIPSIFWN